MAQRSDRMSDLLLQSDEKGLDRVCSALLSAPTPTLPAPPQPAGARAPQRRAWKASSTTSVTQGSRRRSPQSRSTPLRCGIRQEEASTGPRRRLRGSQAVGQASGWEASAVGLYG